MPACFQLFKKGSNVPERFCDVDDAICAFLGVTPHAVHYVYGWYDSIGLLVAIGNALGSQELRDKIAAHDYEDGRLTKVLSFLESEYSSDAWYERKGML